MALRLDGIGTTIEVRQWLVLISVLPITIFTSIYLGLYRAIIRYMADKAARTIVVVCGISALSMFITSHLLELGVPRSVPGIYFALVLIATAGSRFLMRSLYMRNTSNERDPVVVYGAGEPGRMVVQALTQSRTYRPGIVIDPTGALHNRDMNGVPIMSPNRAADFIAKRNFSSGIVAMYGDAAEAIRKAGQFLSDCGLEVRVMPALDDLVAGSARVSEFRRITIEELLGREPVAAIPTLMKKTVRGKSVMITGAGGSIGSELCRQILSHDPKKLVLLEISEFALYQIHEELISQLTEGRGGVEIIPVLGSSADKELLRRVIADHQVNTLLHAAAYKHVPLVESNVAQGAQNNILSTIVASQVAGELGVDTFTLVSSDKAVRPTNVMGATKRVAELAMLEISKSYGRTRYCAVRFGNVLGSSGSVIPKFEQQIRSGGPITITDPEIIRYFMTGKEAAQLVLQASAMSDGGEIFLLDMGKPVKIIDLARTMAKLHRKHTYVEGAEKTLENSIAIRFTGLRPGEKLYEELLVTSQSEATDHPRIMKEADAHREMHSISQKKIEQLEKIIRQGDDSEIRKLLSELPIDYNQQ
ncbi:polysaccharide biosynthesis protein [Rhodobacterales bacterium LSUCC0246]|nr:polysaccharide biosynthesis protein [Rhodobacterales bacterium LSUCC0374]